MSDKTVVIGPALGFDEKFGQRLYGDPPYRPDSGNDFIDERFGQLDMTGSGAGSRALKQFLQEQTAEQTPATTVRIGDAEFRVYYKDGSWRGKGVLNGQLHRFTGDSRDAVLTKIMALAKRETTIPELTPEQKLEVIRICQAGDRLTAIGAYLKHRLGEAIASKYDSPIEMMSDPKLVPVMNDAAEFTWFNSNPHAQDSAEWHRYKQWFLAGRPTTHQLLDAAYLAYQDFCERQNESQVQYLDEPVQPDSPETLDDLDDEAINKTYWSTLKHAARSGR